MTVLRSTSLLFLASLSLIFRSECQDEPKQKDKPKEEVVFEGAKACAREGESVWEVADGDNKCDAVVQYRGAKTCDAYFDDPNAADAVSKKVKDAPSGDVTIKGLKKLVFHCNGEREEGECHYTIKQIHCGQGMTPGTSPPLIYPSCNTNQRLLKAPSAGTKCNVTVQYTGSKDCEAAVWTVDDHHLLGTGATSAFADTKLRTYQGIDKELHAACKGDTVGGCSFSVKYVECTP